MKKITYTAVVILLVIAVYASAETEKIINTSNEYGGKTKESVYLPSDEQHKQGIMKVIDYYDGDGKVVKGEVYLVDDYAKKAGIMKVIDYYDSDGKVVKQESYDLKGNKIP